MVLCLAAASSLGIVRAQQPPPPAIVPKPEELAKVKEKTEAIEQLIRDLKTKHPDPALLADVEVYAKAGNMLLEYPELFGTQAAIDHSFLVLDDGLERARQLKAGQPHWDEGKKRIEAYRSDIDGALQPYGITLRSVEARPALCLVARAIKQPNGSGIHL